MGADRIISGNIGTTMFNPYDNEAIVLDQTSGIIYASTKAKQLVANEAILAEITPFSTTVPAAGGFITLTLPPGLMNVVGRMVRLKARMIVNLAQSSSPNVNVGFNGASVGSVIGGVIGAATFNSVIDYEAIVTTTLTGTAGSLWADICLTSAAAGATATNPTAQSFNTNGIANNLNLTGPNVFTFQIGYSAAAQALGQVRTAFAELLR